MSTKCDLKKEKCIPCTEFIPPLKGKELHELHLELKPGWNIIKDHKIEKDFKFPDFVTALAFTNKVGELAEEQGHHPDILLTWGNVKVTLWTHKINGLSRSDFILAAKTDGLYKT